MSDEMSENNPEIPDIPADQKPVAEQILDAAQLIIDGMERLVIIDQDNKRVLNEYNLFKTNQIALNKERTEQIKKLKKTNWRQLILLGIFAAFVIINQNRFDDQTVAAKKSCKTANENRAKDKALWDFVINASSQPSTRVTTPEEKVRQTEILSEFRVLVNDKDALRDCNKAASKNPVVTVPSTTVTTG